MATFAASRDEGIVMRAFVTSEVGGRARALATALLLLLLAINGLNVVNSYVGRDFMTAIESRSMPAFIGMALLYVSVFAVSTVTSVIYRFAEERLGLLWRGWLTRRLVGGYSPTATTTGCARTASSAIPTSASPTTSGHSPRRRSRSR